MQETIAIFIHSYKNKNLKSIIDNILKESSKKNILRFFICDQSNINREKDFYSNHNVKYVHIRWDDHVGVPHYRNMFLKNNYDYFLEVSEHIELKNNWDITLINFLKSKNNLVVSGKGKTDLSINNFLINKKEEFLDNFYLNNWIDMNFIFLNKKNIKFLSILNNLKYYGQDILLSIELILNDINIYSCPSNFYLISKVNNLEDSFCSYDLYHNYNESIDYLKKNKNKLNNFENYKNINISDINYLPFDNIGVSYKNTTSNLDTETNRFFPGFDSIKMKVVS
jgi:hypothetical protein